MKKALILSLAVNGCALGFAQGSAAAPAPELQRVLSAPHVTADMLDALYRDAILRSGNVDEPVRQLLAIGADKLRPNAERAQAELVASHLLWRYGRIAEATNAATRGMALEESIDLVLQHARLLEAAGRIDDARALYTKALARIDDPERKEDVQLRLTFLSTDASNVGALVELAKTRDREFRNRAAVALAILGHPAQATELFEIYGDGEQVHRQHLRLAQWAVQARQPRQAQDAAWEAVTRSTLSRDVRYALSVLQEAHELDGSWERLLERLSGRPQLGDDAMTLRIEILRRLGRMAEAIALVESDGLEKLSPDAQRRLLRMYREAGRADEMVAAFSKLIDRDPSEVSWPRSLAEHYLDQGRRDEAEKVWRTFLGQNRQADVLLGAAEALTQLGLDELALFAAARCEELNPDRRMQAEWYRFDHYFRRGQVAEAEKLLERLERETPVDSPVRIEIADAYERMKNPKKALAVWESIATRPQGIGAEEKMRLAWLFDAVGRRDDALRTWRELWEGNMPEARRRLIEDRLLQLAAELGSLGGIAIELEDRLAAGKADPKDSALLVRIYREIDDPASAVEVIQEYFRRGETSTEAEIARLKELAGVFRALNRNNAFNQVTERLLQLDPANATEYLQSLVLNHIERNRPEDRAQIQTRLAQLRAADASANDEFEAGVLVMAGMRDQAIRSYRAALARHPQQNDNYLLLVDLLRQDRRVPEAVAILQYFAEIAGGDDAFVVAIDGLLNLQLPPDSAALRWAQRRVLERIARHDNKFHLYDLSAELAEELRDFPAYFASLENALVDAGPRRSTVLRELMAATAERSMFEPMGATQPDLRKNLAFSRRLIALGDELPPDVYLDLGRNFLALGEPGEALQAFNLAIDRTDRPTLLEDAADRFEAAGYDAEAATLYQKALTGNVDNAGVMMKLARVRNRAGAPAQAAEMYLRALARLADQQPVEVDLPATRSNNPREANDGFSYQFKQHGTFLQNGLLLTLDERDSAALDELEKLVDAAIAEVVERSGGKISRPVSNFPRVNAVTRLARTTALASGEYAFADRIDQKLLRHFAHDESLVTQLVGQRLELGLRESAETLCSAEGITPEARTRLTAMTTPRVAVESLGDLRATARDALQNRRFDLAVEASLAAGEPDLAYAAYVEWLTSAPQQRPRGAAAAGGTIVMVAPGVMMTQGAGTGRGVPALRHAQTRLDAKRFELLCRQAATQPSLPRELLVASDRTAKKPLITLVEEAQGRPLFTPAELETAVLALEPRQLLGLELDYVLARISDDAKSRLLVKQLEGPPSFAGFEPTMKLIEAVLAKPVAAEQVTRIETALKGQLARLAQQSPYGPMQLVAAWNALILKSKSIDAAHAPFVSGFTKFLEATYPVDPSMGIQFAINRGIPAARPTVAELVTQLTAPSPGRPQMAVPMFAQPPMARYALFLHAQHIYPAMKAELLGELERRAAGEMKPEIFHAIVAVHESDPARDFAPLYAWLDGILAREPKNQLVLETMVRVSRLDGNPAREVAALARMRELLPNSEPVRTRMAEIWTVLDHPENALAAGAKPEPPNSRTQNFMFYLPPQARRLVEQLAKPNDEASSRRLWSGLFQMLPPAWTPQNYYYFPGMNGPPVISYFAFFGTDFKNLATRGPNSPLAATVPSLIAGGREAAGDDGEPKLIDLAARSPAALAELEDYVRSLDPAALEREEQFRFYGALAEAYVNAGRARAEFDRLHPLVAEGRAGKKETVLWHELALRLPRENAASLPDIAEKAIARRATVGTYERVLLARLHAHAGNERRALGVYGVVLANVLSSPESASMRMGGPPALLSLTGIIGDAGKWLTKDGFAQFLAQTAQLARPSANDDSVRWHRRFQLILAEKALLAGVPPDRIRPLFEGFDSAKFGRTERVRYANVLALAGTDAALDALRLALEPGVQHASDLETLNDSNVRAYATRLGLAPAGYYPVQYGANFATDITLFREIFPAVEIRAGTRDWVARAAAAIPGWISSGKVDRALATQVLALAVIRLQQLGAPGLAAHARALAETASADENPSRLTGTLVAEACDLAGHPLGSALAAKLVRQSRIEVAAIDSLVRSVARGEGAAAALEVGELALDYTQHSALLDELGKLAQQLGDEARVTRFAMVRQRAETARKLLESSTTTSTASVIR